MISDFKRRGSGVVLLLMAIDYPVGTYTVASIALIGPALVLGWFLVRKKVDALAQHREGHTGAADQAVL